MELPRSFGVLLHPTSLPGPWGIGVLGREARMFVDWLQAAGARWWQMLPLGPTGYGDSPYQSVSSFAGNPYLIDPEDLMARGWLAEEKPPRFPGGWVDYGWQYGWKWPLLRRAFAGFGQQATPAERAELTRYRKAERYWLEDHALFCALKEQQQHAGWGRWPEALRRRRPAALKRARTELAAEIDFFAWTQWVFARQWAALRGYAAEHGIGLIGDLPIFVSHDAPEVWAHPEMFQLDPAGRPTVVAGVPPDYFSASGQLWGNPLYNWEAHRDTGFTWWIERLRTSLNTCNLVRIDHFRGFEAYWEVPAGAPNAIEGRWVKAPGAEVFEAVRRSLGDAPILAEDLGVITPEVERLRDALGFPGMKVLQFAFDGDPDNAFLPHHHAAHGRYAVYTGTHDNETTLGWYRNLNRRRRSAVQDYLVSYELTFKPDSELPWSFIELALRSPGLLAVAPMQDILALGNEARMNTPSTAEGNWQWRCRDGDFLPKIAARLSESLAQNDRAAPGR